MAPSNATVLLVGETGTGKELVARAIHLESPRAKNPFVAINCSAIPETLFESELFGHERGAFTGASEPQRGKIELAHEGTLFLDEIAEMPLALQPKLLRCLEERSFYRLGSSIEIDTDVRVVAASSKDLRLAVSEGAFREDLFHRLNVVPINLPPLRERREDIPMLAEAFLNEFSRGRHRFALTPSRHCRRFHGTEMFVSFVTRSNGSAYSHLPAILTHPICGCTESGWRCSRHASCCRTGTASYR